MQTLLNFEQPKPKPTQNQEIKRVSDKIEKFVVEFIRLRGRGRVFYGDELTKYVQERASCSATSPMRIFRKLNQKEFLVELRDRSKSKYQIIETEI